MDHICTRKSLVTCIAAFCGRATLRQTFFAAVTCLPVVAGAAKPGAPSIEVSLVTVGPGSESFSWLGHAAILLTYPVTGEQREFDYGVMITDAGTRRRVLTGTADAHVSMSEGHAAMATWARLGRAVTLQRLNLTEAQGEQLISAIVADQVSGNAYRYNLLTDNCTTHIRDLLDLATNGALRRAGQSSTGMTIRDLGARQLQKSWLVAMFDLILNNEADRKVTQWEAAALPAELSRLVARTSLPDARGNVRPLAHDTFRGWSRMSQVIPAVSDKISFLLLGVVIASVGISTGVTAESGNRTSRAALGLTTAALGGAFGLLGTVVTAGWLMTEYPFAQHNVNVLVVSPLLLVAVPLGIGYAFNSAASGRLLSTLLNLCVFSNVLAVLLNASLLSGQDNTRTLLLVMPAITGIAYGVRRSQGQIFARFAPLHDHSLADGDSHRNTTRPASKSPIFWSRTYE